jgi:hypothetical protein
MNIRSNHFANWIFQKMFKVVYAFFPQKWTNLKVMTANQTKILIRSLLGKKRIDHFLKNPLCEVIWPNVHVNGKRFRSTNFERPEKSSGPTDRAETLYFALNTLNLYYKPWIHIPAEYCFLWNTLLSKRVPKEKRKTEFKDRLEEHFLEKNNNKL